MMFQLVTAIQNRCLSSNNSLMFLNLTSSYWYTYVWMSRTCFASKLINSYF
jgi:hypothetical protein